MLNLAQGDPVQLSSGDSVPQWLGWLNNDTVLAVYENCAVVYGADGGERGRFDLGGGSLVSVSQDGANAALLLENGQVCTAVLLDKDLNVQYSGNSLRQTASCAGVKIFICLPTVVWNVLPQMGCISGDRNFPSVRRHSSRASSCWCCAATRCSRSLRRSKRLPVPSDRGKNSIFAGK